MPNLSFTTVDVFTTERYVGNPLAIVNLPVGHGVSDEQLQLIAREFNLSETVFISERQEADDGLPQWRVRIFMANAELPFAGHPTIGSACSALVSLPKGAKKGRLICNAGPIEVDYQDGLAKASIPHNFHQHVENELSAKDVYALQPQLDDAGIKPQAVDLVSPVKGMNFLAVQLASLADLRQIATTGLKPDVQLDRDWNVGFKGSYFYVITSTEDNVVGVRTRMIEGALEDPATGSAACGLSCFLALRLGLGTRTKFEVVQGVEMGRRSDIGVEVELSEGGKEVERVELSGRTVKVMEGSLEV